VQTDTTLVLSAELPNLAKIRRFIEKRSAALKLMPEAAGDIRLAVDEAATNIILHGYRGKQGTIEVEMIRKDDDIVVYLRDSAPVFDPTTVPPPDLTIPFFQRPPGGMGVHLIRQAVDKIYHRISASGGNELTLVKRDG
jgi:serine/threonine-protein kinase RsbW